MDYNKIIEHFAQKVDESRREEFREKASKIKDASEAEALAKEYGIVPDAEDRKLMLEMAGDMELSADMLRQVAGGDMGDLTQEELDELLMWWSR